MTIQSFRFLFFLFCIALLTNSCVTNPVTGKKEFSVISLAQEQAMGDQYDPSIVASFGLYQDDNMQKFINERGLEMAKISHRPELEYEFKVLDSPVVNAFAVPGGYVYFTRGIMAHFNNEAEFAGVLGHEIGHITARHSAKQQSNQMLLQVLVIGGIVVSEKFRQYSDVAMQGLGLLSLKFSRSHESQSDELGVQYSTAVGYDSHQMADFFQTISRISSASGQSIPDFMSTHPNPDDRYNKVHQMSTDIQLKYGKKQSDLKVRRNEYLQLIEGLVHGEDPRQGFVENWMFYHPELKFQFPVPQNWKYQNSPAQFQMAPEDGKALIQLSLGQGNSLVEAKNKMIEQYKLTEKSSQNVKVNGMNALKVLLEQVPQQQQGQQQQQQAQTIDILTYLIEYNGLIYKFMGMSTLEDYPTYEPYFNQVMPKFNVLRDSDKLNRQPDRIRIKTVRNNGTLESALKSFNQPSDRYNELAILNGMELSTTIKAGDKIKTIGK